MSGLLAYGLPLAVAVLVWFFATGLIFRLDSLPRRTFALSLGVASVVAVGGLVALVWTAGDTDQRGAYLAFAAALAVWAWHELSFLTGTVTGPRRVAAPAGVEGWRRFRLATATLIHHEIALAATALGIAALTWGQPNQTGTLTFALLLVMRLSTKLNIFTGVPNPASDLLPPHLAYLKSYYRKRPAGPLMAASLTLSLGLAALWLSLALGAAPGSGAQVGAILLFGLTLLAIVEHLFLALPVRDAALWSWASPRSAKLQPTSAPAPAGGGAEYV